MIEECAHCGQQLLTSPDDPNPRLWCDSCLADQRTGGTGRAQLVEELAAAVRVGSRLEQDQPLF